MTTATTNPNPANAEELTEAAIDTRDSWRAFATYVIQNSPAPQLPGVVAEAYELLQDALAADEGLADMLASSSR